MAIVLTSQPSSFGLVYNDNPFTMYSTNYSPTQRFAITVLPTNINTQPVFGTFRVYPRIDSNGGVNKAYFDPSRILQSTISSDIAIPGANNNAFFPCNNSHDEYLLFIVEEDKDAQGVYQTIDSTFTEVRSVWNGVRDLTDWLDFDYNLYIMGTSVNRFLTEAPRTQYLNTNQSYFLHFIATSQNAGKSYKINVYDASDNLTFASTIDNPNASFITSTYDYKYQRIAVGSYDISNMDATLSSTAGIGSALNGASYYTIQLFGSSSNRSEMFTFKLDQQCSKYEPVRLQWLNRLGGYDSFNFNFKSEVKTGVKRETYDQQPHTFTGTSWEYTKASRGTTQYHTALAKETTVNTGYLDDATSLWMEDLFTSPVVYIESNNELIAVNISGRSINKQTSLNDKLCQYTFDIEYALTNIRQRG